MSDTNIPQNKRGGRFIKPTPSQRLIADIMQTCQRHGLPSSEVRPIMRRIGDVNEYAPYPAKYKQYLEQVEAQCLKYLQDHPKKGNSGNTANTPK